MKTEIKAAVCFLANKVKPEIIQFAGLIKAETKFDVYIIDDDCGPNKDGALIHMYRGPNIVRIPDKDCIANGFLGCNITGVETHIQKPVIAYDKFLRYFTKVNTDFDFIWVFEDDVFIPSIDVLDNLHKKYRTYDLVTPNHFPKHTYDVDWHWQHICSSIDGPWFASMVCAAGFSRAMLTSVADYRDSRGKYFYIEGMFNTLAAHHNLKVKDAFELKSCVWQGKWGLDEFILLPNNIFHPLKDADKHEGYRKSIAQAIAYKYKPIDTLPHFLKAKV